MIITASWPPTGAGSSPTLFVKNNQRMHVSIIIVTIGGSERKRREQFNSPKLGHSIIDSSKGGLNSSVQNLVITPKT